jgi:aldose 1-epimerase
VILFSKQMKRSMDLKKKAFGKTGDGKPVDLFTLANAGGMQVKIATYGATVVSLRVPDRSGASADVVLGYDSLEGYIAGESYFGCIAGRYANRIAAGKFTLHGKKYRLAANEAGNHLHGGQRGFGKVVWQAREFEEDAGAGLILSYISPDGEEGYPGNLECTVRYTLGTANELKIDYRAVADAPTIVNLTNHAYFNLGGAGSGDILNHELMINADRFTPVDGRLIPTGEMKSVSGTPFDFTRPTAIGARIDHEDEQLIFGKGYDHNWVLNKKAGGPCLAARAFEGNSGRILKVYTTQPGLQFYSGNFLDGRRPAKAGRIYPHRGGFCLETQHFPDSPNRPDFPSTVLEPGSEYKHTTIYKFAAA